MPRLSKYKQASLLKNRLQSGTKVRSAPPALVGQLVSKATEKKSRKCPVPPPVHVSKYQNIMKEKFEIGPKPIERGKSQYERGTKELQDLVREMKNPEKVQEYDPTLSHDSSIPYDPSRPYFNF